MSLLWLGQKSFIRVVGRSRSPVTRRAPAKEGNLHEHPAQFAFSNPGADELRNYLRLPLDSMADFFESTLAGIRMEAKAGKSRHALRNIAAFASRAYMASDRRITPEGQAGSYQLAQSG